MIKKVQDFLDREIEYVKIEVEKNEFWWDKQCFQYAISRGFGAVQFARSLGAGYEETELLYNKFEEEIENIKKEWLTKH